MAETPRNPDLGDDAALEPDNGSPPGTPRWVKMLAVITLVVIGLVVVLVLAGGHTPMQHGP